MPTARQNNVRNALAAVASACLVALSAITPVEGHETPEVLAPGWGPLEYVPPEPGSYALPVIGPARDATVLDSNGDTRRLHDVFEGRITLFSFIYTTCSDKNGCPLATAVLHQIKQRMRADPELRENLRLVSLSFDPVNDTPEVMSRYGGESRDTDWVFLTTASQAELTPVLNAYDQLVEAEIDQAGNPLGTFSHLLRVYLIDREQRIRNIYNVTFLHADLVVNDIKTLVQAEGQPAPAKARGLAVRYSAGDDKQGYERTDYRTDSASLTARRGRPADLLGIARNPPLGLPPVPIPAENSLSVEKIELGRKLFFDRRLSLNNTFSCAMCHVPEQGFTHNELATAVGIEGRTVKRNAPTLFNVAYAARLFHDAREFSLEQQIWGPLLAPNEMGNPSVGAVIAKLGRLPDYAGRFESVFGRGPGMEVLGQALAAYQRTLLAADSPFDRWRYGGDENAMSEAAKRGFALFTGRGRCSACHLVGERWALFTDQQLHNTGIGYRESMSPEPKLRRVAVAPGVFLDVEASVLSAASERKPNDLGRYEVTQDPDDRWRYKTPTLRNVALTAPYMHNGSLATLADVVDFYNRGGFPNELSSPLLRPLGLSEGDKGDLVAFLESLTGSNTDILVGDAFSVPVGDVRAAEGARNGNGAGVD